MTATATSRPASPEPAHDRINWYQPSRAVGAGRGPEPPAYVHPLTPHLMVEIGYAHFFPGAFTRNTGESPDADLFYVHTFLEF